MYSQRINTIQVSRISTNSLSVFSYFEMLKVKRKVHIEKYISKVLLSLDIGSIMLNYLKDNIVLHSVELSLA